MTPIRSRHAALIDTCGTGGDGSRHVQYQHGGGTGHGRGRRARGETWQSRDVQPKRIGRRLGRLGRERGRSGAGRGKNARHARHLFLLRSAVARRHGPSGRSAKTVGLPHDFQFTGAADESGRAPFQLLGVSKPEYCNVLAEALALLGTERAVVVSGEGPLDEVTIAGETEATVASEGMLRQFNWTPAEFGLERQSLDTLVVDGPQASAAMIRRVLAGAAGPARDIVVANAAAASGLPARRAVNVAATAAQEAIDSGAAANLLQRLVEETNRDELAQRSDSPSRAECVSSASTSCPILPRP